MNAPGPVGDVAGTDLAPVGGRALVGVDEAAYEGVEPGDLGDEYPDENFRVVEPPIGVTVTVLPEDTAEKKVGDDTYFAYAGTWYKPFYSGEEVVYMVQAAPVGAAG
jgi:hypothetical protein